jgi:hypothetical protein
MSDMQMTFYSVPGPNHSPGMVRSLINGGWKYALKNMEFLSDLNPDVKFTVVLGHLLEWGEVPPLPQFENVSYELFEIDKQELNLKYPQNPSSQHGSILNFLLSSHPLATKYFGIIDPDCYLLRLHGIKELIHHLDEKGLSSIGAGYPSTWVKPYYWDFPTAYFQLINSEKIRPFELDFLPDESTYVVLRKDPTKTVLPLSWLAKSILGLKHKQWVFGVYGILRRFVHANNSFSIFMRHFQLNYPYRDAQLFRDTGWRNRDMYKDHKIEVLPHAIPRRSFTYKFNVRSYLESNHDVMSSNVDAGWHFLTNGIYERRNIGDQIFYFRLFNRLLQSKHLSQEVHPASSMVMADEFILDSPGLKGNWGSMTEGFEYFWKSRPYCLHLGHGGKQDPDEDMVRLDRLKNYILEGRQNVS